MRRWLAVMLFALWWGGFTFYAVVAVPTGHKVLHSKVRQGFITQQVTNKLNFLGAMTVAALAIELAATRRDPARCRWWKAGVVSLAVMATSLAAIFWLHGRLDALLDPATLSVIDDHRFYALHRVYLIVATGQWLASLVCWIWLFSGWTVERKA